MAISVQAQGTWAEVTNDAAVTLPTGAAGDRIYVFAAWKAFSITAQISGYTEVTEFADGSVATGANVGSVKVGAWYKDHSGSEANPTLDFSGACIGATVAIILRKGSDEAWDVPTFVTAAITAVSPWSATSSATITILDASIVLELIGLRDDSSTMTRSATTALEDDGSPDVTWNGNVVETVATHFSTTNGDDISADLVHRLVTTGASGVNLTTTGTPAAAETGSALWIHQSVITDTAYTNMVQALAPSGFWPLDDRSGNARDASGNGRPGTASGTITTYRTTGPTINGVAQTAMTWGASGQFSVVESIDDDVVQFTVAVWFKTSNTATGTGLMGQYAGGTNAQSSWLFYKQSGASSHIACFVYSGGAEATVYPETSTGYADGAWHLAVAWRDSGGVFHVRVDDTTQVDATPDVTWKGPCTTAMLIGAGGGTYVGDLALAMYWKTDIGVAKRSALFSGVYTEVERGNPPFDVLQAVARAGSW